MHHAGYRILQNKVCFQSSHQPTMNIGKGCCLIVGIEFSFFCLLLYIDWLVVSCWSKRFMGWVTWMIWYVCVWDLHACVYFLLFVNMAFWIHVWFYTLNATVDTFFLSIHSVLMFCFASSMKENSKLTAVQSNSRRGDSDADSIYPRTHFWLVAAAGMYSCPVATMFCEKLLTRRDIAENLRASVTWR